MADVHVSDTDVILSSDSDGKGGGDIIFTTGGVERARILSDGSATGVFGGTLTSTGSWLAATAYKANQIVTYNGTAYRCLVAHTSPTVFPGAGTTWESWGPLDPRALRANVLKPFWAGLARARSASGACDVVTIGTSITEGFGPSAYTNRWLDALRDRLRAQWQPAGVTGGYGFLPPQWVNPSETPAAAVIVGSPSFNGDYGLGKRNARMSGSQTITWTFTGTGVDIIYTAYSSGGTLSYSIDGGSTTNFATNTAPTTECGHVIQIRSLTAASHTIQIAVISGVPIIEGIMVYNGDETNGVRVWDGGRSGALSSQFFGSTDEFWWRVLSTIQPSLVLVELGANDVVSSIAIATFKSNLQAIVAHIRAQVTIPPAIVLTSVWYRAGISTAAWDPYHEAIRQVVETDGQLLFHDMRARSYSTATENTANALGILASDTIHPSNLGSQVYADSLLELVRP